MLNFVIWLAVKARQEKCKSCNYGLSQELWTLIGLERVAEEEPHLAGGLREAVGEVSERVPRQNEIATCMDFAESTWGMGV